MKAAQACIYQAPCPALCMAALDCGGALLGTDSADLQVLRPLPGGGLACCGSLGPTAPLRGFAVADLAGLSQNQACPAAPQAAVQTCTCSW